jgi:uracil phosphoribosyltransferase
MAFRQISNPLLRHKITHMRKSVELCPSREFVQLMKEVGMVMACEVMRELYKADQDLAVLGINTEDEIDEEGNTISRNYIYHGKVLENKKPVMIPLLRSGSIMAQGMQEVISTTFTGHIGIYNEERQEDPTRYLTALPDIDKNRYHFIIDPVIATGKTALKAIETLSDNHVPDDMIVFVCLLVGEKGQKLLNKELFPKKNPRNISLFAVDLDEKMIGNNLKFGFGSVSERQFRTI